jgi:hypothetical protein
MSRGYWGLAAIAFGLQCLLQGAFFPWSELSSAARIGHIDAPFHQYQIALARDLCREGLVLGYEPRFGGGHLGGVTFNASAKLPAVLSCLLPDAANPGAIYKHVSFWSGAIAPALVVVACAMVGMSVWPTALATALGMLLWWTGPLRWYHTAGMVSWVAVCYASLAFTSTFVHWSGRPSVLRLVILGLAASLAFLVHPLFAVASALLGVAWLVERGWNARDFGVRLGVALLTIVVMVACAWPWLVPSLDGSSGFANAPTPYQRAVDPWLFVREMAGTAPTAAGGSRLYAALLVASVLGIALVRGPARSALIGLGIGAVFLMLWASVGALSPRIAILQPNRFSAMAWLALTLPAAAGMAEAFRRVVNAHGTTRWLWLALTAGILLLPIYFVREVWREVYSPVGAPRYGVQPPEVKGAGPVENAVVDLLRRGLGGDSRVYFENSLARVHDGGHVAGMVALRSGRALIGGPYPFTLFATGWDGSAFQRPIAELDPQQLAAWLDAYNVRVMLCHSPGCTLAMSRVADTITTAELGPVTAYERKSSPGYVAGGEATVQSQCTNRVEVGQVKTQRVVLRFQWVPGLRAVPSGRVMPIRLDPDLPPFVAVDDAPPRFALRLGSGDGIACAERPLQWRQLDR